jgi:ABC-2 type transport system permease protein
VKLLSSIRKELILLFRDTAGLLVLFVMPVVLVIVVTLVQENVLKSMGEKKMRILLIELDGDSVGLKIEEALRKSGVVEIVKELHGKRINVETARKAVAKGEFQFCIVVPQGITKAFRDQAKKRVKGSLSVSGTTPERQVGTRAHVPELLIYFDPTLRETFRLGIISSMEKVILGLEGEERIRALSEILPLKMEEAAKKAMGPAWSESFKKAIPGIKFDMDERPIVTVREGIAQYGRIGKAPSTVQQNVPAWTLFGMFFVIVPLGASLIRERQDGMLARLLTMPVSYLTFMSGKIAAYVTVCMAQFLLIMAVGKTVLPLLGAPALEIGSSPISLVLIALSSALAASGYGILLGTIARTYEQASTFGAVSVVIAAALGGVMVPLYVMPGVMQTIGAFSPLAWGLNAFLSIFVRGGGIYSILPEVGMMLLFFVATTLLAWFYMFQRGRIRIH